VKNRDFSHSTSNFFRLIVAKQIFIFPHLCRQRRIIFFFETETKVTGRNTRTKKNTPHENRTQTKKPKERITLSKKQRSNANPITQNKNKHTHNTMWQVVKQDHFKTKKEKQES